MKKLQYILGVSTVLTGLTMIGFTFYFWCQDDEAMVVLASLYVALLISIIVMTFGLMVLTGKDK